MTSALTIRPEQVQPTDVFDLAHANDLAVFGEARGAVTGITLNSRDVRPGDLYVGMPGAKRHGAEFAKDAEAAGAVAILTDNAGRVLSGDLGIPVLVTEHHPRTILGAVASRIYDTEQFEPHIFGVTGTNGKTSVVYMLDALLRVAGLTTGISTTAERRIGNVAIESDLTSPEASEMHGLLARMVEDNVTAVGVEVSAQAIVRHRIDSIMFDVVAFNNFSQDHLDEFGDMETYFAAKLGLFMPERAKRGVVVVDGPHGRRLARESQIPVATLATEYGHEADWHLALTSHTIDGASFVLQGPHNAYFRGRVPVFGRFMAENAALALIMMHEAGINIAEVERMLNNTPIPVAIPGRLELMNPGVPGPRFYVDYGHTPGSFDSMLDALGEVTRGRVIFMFGADGDRDTTKRAEMGRIAAAGSQVLIICDYHPRFEDPAEIRSQLLEGARSVGGRTEIHEIADPRQAMRYALEVAAPDDVIVYAGPGHETHQEVAGALIPYSARDEVRGALREVGLLA